VSPRRAPSLLLQQIFDGRAKMFRIVIEKPQREIASTAKQAAIASRDMTVIEAPALFAGIVSSANRTPAALFGEHLISLFVGDAVGVFELASSRTQPLLFKSSLSPIQIIIGIFGAKRALICCIFRSASRVGSIQFAGSLIFQLAISFPDRRQFNP